jgi:hypothetical protein
MSRWLSIVLVAWISLFGVARFGPAQADTGDVDLLLVLAVDISRSVDTAKFKLQREGYATALTDPKVLSAIRSVPTSRIAVTLFEWSGAYAQVVVIDWTEISTTQQAEAIAARLREAPRAFAERTAIGTAIDYAVGLVERSPFKAARVVIDVSGDGTSNSGRFVTEARDEAVARGITINGLAILSAVPLPSNPMHTHPPGGLLKYYEDNVIGGPGAFAIAAQGHEDFGKAILAKLVKEIALAPAARRARTVVR